MIRVRGAQVVPGQTIEEGEVYCLLWVHGVEEWAVGHKTAPISADDPNTYFRDATPAPSLPAPDVAAAIETLQSVWESWLYATNWPFDWTTPTNQPPTTPERMGRIWNERDNWRITDDEAADCIADESGMTRTNEGTPS